MCVYTWCVHVNLCMCVSLFSDCSVCYRVLISEKGGISQLILTNKQTPKWLMAQTQCKFLSHGKSKRGTSGPRAALFPWLFRNPNSSYLLPSTFLIDPCRLPHLTTHLVQTMLPSVKGRALQRRRGLSDLRTVFCVWLLGPSSVFCVWLLRPSSVFCVWLLRPSSVFSCGFWYMFSLIYF